MSEPTELMTINQQYQLGALNITTPSEVITVATKVATQLADLIVKKNLFKVIGGRKHVYVDGWTTLGAMLGVVPRHQPEYSIGLPGGGYQETVELVRMSDGMIIGRGSAVCGTADEVDSHGKMIWGARPTYAQKSMAITRATGKAFRLTFSWVMVLAGFNPTPAEEMDFEHENSQPQSEKVQTKKTKSLQEKFFDQCIKAKEYFNKKTGKDDVYNSIIGKFGFSDVKEIVKEADQKAILNTMKERKELLENQQNEKIQIKDANGEPPVATETQPGEIEKPVEPKADDQIGHERWLALVKRAAETKNNAGQIFGSSVMFTRVKNEFGVAKGELITESQAKKVEQWLTDHAFPPEVATEVKNE
jgi:hypothetical protein